MDKFGLSIIKADSKESINPLKDLLQRFGIKCYTLADRDDGSNNNFDFITYGKDFDEDVVNALFDFSDGNENKKREIIYDILSELYPNDCSKDQRKFKIKNLNKEDTLKTLKHSKGIIMGNIIGKNVPKEYIPQIIKDLISQLKKD